jgi:hypothetical protein
MVIVTGSTEDERPFNQASEVFLIAVDRGGA